MRVRDGKRLVTDGPFAETREHLGGYFLVDAGNLDEAIGIAGRIPGARVGTVEIRPVIEIPGLPAEEFKGCRCGSIPYGDIYSSRSKATTSRSSRWSPRRFHECHLGDGSVRKSTWRR